MTKIGVYLPDDIGTAAAFAGAALVLVSMLWRTTHLLAADWIGELRCREAWGAVAVGAGRAVPIDDRPPVEQPYWPARARRGKCHGGVRLAMRLRRVANASADDERQDARPRVRVMGVPIRIVSDIVVLGQSRKEHSDSGDSHKAHLDGGLGEARLTPSRRPVDEAALAEARRKVLALAEALGRQAAREDDAAEQAKKRSSTENGATPGKTESSVDKDETG